MSDQTHLKPESRNGLDMTAENLTESIVSALLEKGYTIEDLKENRLARKVLTQILRETAQETRKGNPVAITNEYINGAITRVLNSQEKKTIQP
jgi:hypothetical protein